MRTHLRVLSRIGAVALAGAALATSASAVPVVYTGQGVLHLIPGLSDLYGLDGATVKVVVTADTGDAPLVEPHADRVDAFYPASTTMTFSNRPGGAPEVVLTEANAGVAASNSLPLEVDPDLFLFGGPCDCGLLTKEGVDKGVEA